MEQVGEYWFEGGLLSISERNETPKRDTMVSVFESELAIGGWDVDLIPFYDVGNGDAYCVSRKNGCVQYVRHEDRFAEQIADSFEGWIKMIPNY